MYRWEGIAMTAMDTMQNNLDFFTSTFSPVKKAVLGAEIPEPGLPCGGYAVFLFASDGRVRARVRKAVGETMEEALSRVEAYGLAMVQKQELYPRWVRLDVVTGVRKISSADLAGMDGTFHEMIRTGVCLDEKFHLAFPEQEMNANKLWGYEKGHPFLDLDGINRHLAKTGRKQIERIPEEIFLFTCRSWFSGDGDCALPLSHTGLTTGRRLIPMLDRNIVKDLLQNATHFLSSQLHDDGSFVYGIYPRFDREIQNYNFMRHTSTMWSLICEYRITKDPAVVPKIDAAFGYLYRNAVAKRGEAWYLTEPKASEIKVGGLGVMVVALSEYIEVILRDPELEIEDRESKIDGCISDAVKFGNGILSMQDEKTGAFTHVWNLDYTVKEPKRTVYYDGEAAFALARLYGLTKDEKWLTAARKAADRFIREDYTRYRDHWIAYAFNEITKYCPEERYYTFALQNAQNNLEHIYRRVTTYHTYLELLMVSFETYDRIVQQKIDLPYLEEFDLSFFLRTIYCRADRMLNGYFFPETVMDMKHPERVLHTFMVRHDGFRVRIDDVQHNIGGYYLYYKNYDRLVSYGMLEEIRKGYGQDRSYGPKI